MQYVVIKFSVLSSVGADLSLAPKVPRRKSSYRARAEFNLSLNELISSSVGMS